MHYESVEPGDMLPALRKGPLTTAHLMRWSAAIENWHRIHYDRGFAVEHDRLPGLMVNGTLKQQFVLETLRRWAGEEGWVWKVAVQYRAMNLEGETLRIWGRVVSKLACPDFGLVELEVGILNDRDAESTPGKAVVALPYRNGKAVPYPFVAPAAGSVT